MNATKTLSETNDGPDTAGITLDAAQTARFQWALEAARLGIPVLPLRPGTKKGFSGWPAMGSTNTDVIRGWITHDYPNCNFGCLMGNGWVCIDLDRHGSDGVGLFTSLYTQPLDTFCVKTPRNGFHYYFRSPDRNYVTVTGDGIDAIGDRAYVVAPYSVIPEGTYVPQNTFSNVQSVPAALVHALPNRFIDLSSATTDHVVSATARQRRANACEIAPLSTEPLNPNEKREITARLRSIDPSLPYEDWYRVIFAALNIWGLKQATVDSLAQWSSNSHKWDQNQLEAKIASYSSTVEHQLGHAYLARTANRYPAVRTPRTLSIPDGAERTVAELASAQAAKAREMLLAFDTAPSAEHAQALECVANAMARGLFTSESFRAALPLETGMGKTTSVVALCSAIAARNIDKALLICCERVQQLDELRMALISHGVSEASIGLHHNSEAYRTRVPAVSLADAHHYQFLLACHQRVKVESLRSDPAKLMRFDSRKRDLVVWDESLISSNGHYVGRKELLDSIALWLGRHEAVTSASGRQPQTAFQSVYSSVRQFMVRAKEVILAADDEVIAIPPIASLTSEAKQAIRNIFGDASSASQEHVSRLTDLIEHAGHSEIRVVRINGDHSLLRFEQTIDDIFNKIVILDASCRIRDLARYDPRLEIYNLPISKRYSNVRVRWVDARASKSSFADPKFGQAHFAAFANHLRSQMQEARQEGWAGIVFCHLENKEQVKEAVDRCKTECGWGVAPIHVLHWGEHRATNRFKDCRWVFFWGVQYLPRGAIAAQVIGQIGRSDYRFMDREIEDVLESEIAESLYQAISRGHSRNVNRGEAGQQVIDLVLPKKQARNVLALLGQVMPGVDIVEVRSPHFEHRLRKDSADYIELAELKAELLMSLGPDLTRVSKREVNRRLNVTANRSTNRNADKYLLKLVTGWSEAGRSLVRLQ